eukprot:1252422-Alexandrium_andersonii.AAC.1
MGLESGPRCRPSGGVLMVRASSSCWPRGRGASGTPSPPPDDFSACRVVLLSLFDGVGTARVARDMALRHYRCTPLLHAS